MRWLLLFFVLAQAPAPDLKSRVQKLIDSSGAEVAVVARTIDGQSEVLIEPDKSFHAASTMKVPVMVELFCQAEAGQLKLDDQLPIRNEFHSIVGGSVYKMDVSDDSDGEVYKATGRAMSLRALCEAMITVSSNFAANLLIERVGAKNVQQTVERMGGAGVLVLRGVEDRHPRARHPGSEGQRTADGVHLTRGLERAGKVAPPLVLPLIAARILDVAE